MSDIYLVHKDHTNELYHYGVKGMKWGHRTRYTSEAGQRYASAKKAYRQAKKDYSKAYDEAHNYSSRHSIRQFTNKKSRAESNKKWDDAYNKANTASKTKTEYNQAKKEYKQSDEYKAKRAKALKVGAAAAGTALAAYGAYKVHKMVRDKNFELAKKKGQAIADKYYNENYRTTWYNKKHGQLQVTKAVPGGFDTKLTKMDLIPAEKLQSRIRLNNGRVEHETQRIFNEEFNRMNNVSFPKAAKNVYDDYRRNRRRR